MSHRNEASVEIEAPPEQVFPWLAEPERRLQWVHGLEVSERTEEGRFREVVGDHGIRTEVDVATTVSDPPARLEARMRGRGLEASVRNRLEPTASGTRLNVTVESEYRGLLARVAAPLVTRHAQSALERSLERLKQLVEAE